MAEDQIVTGGQSTAARAALAGENPGGGSAGPGGNNAPPGTDQGAAGRGQLIGIQLAGRLVKLTPERVRQLSRDGWIEKQGRDQFYLVDVVHGYIDFLRDENRRAAKSAADSRVRDARAREVELRIAERERRLVEATEMIALADQLVGMFRAALSGLPARVTRDLQIRRTIETAIDELLNRIADECAAAAESAGVVAAGGADDPPVAAASA